MEEERSHYIPLPLRILAGTLMRERNESGKTVNQISEQTASLTLIYIYWRRRAIWIQR